MNIIASIFLIIISIFGFLGFGFLGYAIDPTYQEIKELRLIRANYVEKRENASKIEKAKMDLKKKYKEISTNDLHKIKKFLPNHIDNIELIVDINRIAKNNNIRHISDIFLERKTSSKKGGNKAEIEIKEKGDYESITLSFSFVSKYENFKIFLNDLKRSLRLVDISNISIRQIENQEENPNANIFQFSLAIRTYWLNK